MRSSDRQTDKDRGAPTPSQLERGRECYAHHAWADAYEALTLADQQTPLAPEDLERLALSAALSGHEEEMVRAHERRHQLLLAAGDNTGAANAAFWVGFRLISLGEAARGGGWLARAQRLIERESQEHAMHGYLQLPAMHRHVAAGDLAAAHAAACEAAAIGERCGDADLVALGRNGQGRTLLLQGRIEQGLALLDEAMLAATTGDLSPVVTGLIYCGAIACCQQVYALDRSREWTAALAGWCATQPQLVGFAGACQVHRAEILELGGAWREAIDEAQRAATVAPGRLDTVPAANASYQLAEIHRLRGELAEAEQAYREASQYGREPQPGLALLRLRQGKSDVALSALRRVLAATQSPLQRARFLPAAVEIMLAAGELEAASEACTELEAIAAHFGTEVLGAIAAHARGALLLEQGDAQAGLEPLRRAFAVWQRIGAPYIAARIRVLLGRGCSALGDEDGAALELSAAREVFERLGAAPDLAALVARDAPAAPPQHGLSARELQVLRLVAAGKTNKLIATELFLSEKTVDRHVSNIFGKLAVTSRAGATAFAYENGLI